MSTTPAATKPELLAPAGSLEAFFAAMEKGADAVYAGLRDFSARAKAKNFTLDQLARMTAYAHERGRKVYVTLNTLVKERELPPLVETLAALTELGTDAVIVQDLAVARLVRRHFPDLPLHASTQLTIHNTPGVQQLAELGFERVVLARELHLDEISDIVRQSPIGIECFIHGALCFSFSGQCYFSSFLGGHSGNRGRCAQPCRRQYRYKGKEGYYFSTNDFSSIDLLPQLVAAGVESFKIEGRMKSAEYVASVIGAYRRALDATPAEWPAALAEAKELLKLSFGRVPTKGFLASHQPTDIATPSLRGATGRFLGEIAGLRGNTILFESRDRLHVGDRLRIQPKSDMAGRAFTVKELFLGSKPVKNVPERSRVAVPAPFPCQKGDAVFKVSSETAFTMSESACLKRLEAVRPAKLPCRLTMALTDATLTVAAQVAGQQFSFAYPLGELEPARTSDMTGVLTAQFERTGDTPFSLAALTAPGFPSLLIPPARLKEIRRDLYRQLADQVLPTLARQRQEQRRRAKADLVGRRPVAAGRRPDLLLRLDNLRDLHLIHQEGVDGISLPVARGLMHQLPMVLRRLKGREGKVVWRLPFIIFERDLPWYREALATLAGWGFRRFEAANLAHFPLLRELSGNLAKSISRGCPGGKEAATQTCTNVRRGDADEANNGSVVKAASLELSTDYRIFSLNSQALLAWQELGVTSATLYIEDDAENLADLLAADLPMTRRVMVYGGVPAITSKIAIKGVKSDTPVLSDRGEGYRVEVKDGLTVLTPTTRFSLTGFRGRLQEMGANAFVIDLCQTTTEEQKQVLAAFAAGRELPETSPFNFVMGLV
jgi:putative protease